MSEPDRLESRDYLALSLIFVLALALRLIRLFDLDVIFDEAVLLIQTRESFAGIWNLCKSDNFPPLYPWLIKVWMSQGSGAEWFRLFGALMGALTPPMAYLLGREAGGRKLAWALGVACALSATLMYYSQCVRMYNVQPFFVCLSLYGFLKAVKTEQWRYWWLTCLANLLGFYVYVFMAFVFAAELVVLIFHYRLEWRQYVRPFVSQLPFFIGGMIWMVPTLQRYTHVQEAFWTPVFNLDHFLSTSAYLSVGVNFRRMYWLAGIMELPILAGLFLGIILKPRRREISILAFTALFVSAIILVISLGGRSFFHDRYLAFVLPLILAVALAGWMKVTLPKLRRLGLGLLYGVMATALIYYYVDFYFTHANSGFIRQPEYTEKGEGHGLSLTAADIAARIQPDEVIIHYSQYILRIASYLPSLVYHQRALPEYIYSHHEIEQHNGRQYLKPGEWIRSLSDLKSMPGGIWVLTLDDPDTMLASRPAFWVLVENLFAELHDAGFEQKEIITHFKVSAIHYRRDPEVGAP